MEPENFRAIVTDVNEKRGALLNIRGGEYGKVQDQLTSFKEIAGIWNILHPEKELLPSNVAEILTILKQIRNANLARQDANPFSPKREDTHLDYHNYLDLQAACEVDEIEQDQINALRKDKT